MPKISVIRLNISAALALSLFLHLVAFGVTAAMQSMVHPPALKEYLPVDLVQLPTPPRREVRVPVAAPPKPVKVPDPVIQKERSVPSPPHVTQKVAELPRSSDDMPSPGTSLPSRALAAPDSGTTGTEQPGTSGTSAPQPQGKDKGSYLAIHKLTRLPDFKSQVEPIYPDSERISGNEARVQVMIYLNEQGKVDIVEIKKSGGKLFDKAALDAARQSSFKPGYIGEKAVPSVILKPYMFKLK
jgi:TonB family protein